MSKKQTLLFLGIIVIAVFFRLFLIGEMPGGLFPDEAANGLDINLMEQGHLQPFYERGNGREGLFFYFIWSMVKLLGRSPIAHHVTSALIGIASVIGCFLLTHKLFQLPWNTGDLDETEHKRKEATVIALLASFIMAASSWHIVLSRTAFRANLIPLFTTFTFYFFLRVVAAKTQGQKYFWSAVSGATFALGFYSYIAYRVMIPIVIALLLWPLLASLCTKPRLLLFKKYLPLALCAGLVFVIFIFPLGKYFYTHPGAFIGRSGQVSVFNPELNGGNLLAAVGEVTKQSLLGYFTQGDLNWRHNISGYPFLSPIISPFFGLGLVLVTLLAARYFFRPVKHAEDYGYFLLAGWFWGMLLPVVTTAEGIPHGLRAIGTIPAVYIISAWMLYALSSRAWIFVDLCKQWVVLWKLKLMKAGLYAVLIAFIFALPLETYNLYFVYAYNSPENFYSFRTDLTTVSTYLKEHGNRNNTYLVLDTFSVQTVDYLTTIDGKTSCDRDPAYRPITCVDDPKNKPYIQVDPEDSWKATTAKKNGELIWLHGLDSGDKIVFAQSSIFDIKKFKAFHPQARLELEVRNKFGQAVLAVYEIQ